VTKYFLDSAANAIQALVRDGYRCVVTGLYDSIADSEDSEEKLNITKTEIKAAGGKVFTECAHLVPDSTYFNVAHSSDKVWPFSSFLDIIFYLYVEGLFCLCVGSLAAVRVRCREHQWRESSFVVQCDDDAERRPRHV
jgi:hypothetical protein